jgi:glycosyltransferase involved in cell wall biosynthesis
MTTFAATSIGREERAPRVLSVLPDCPYPAITGLQLRMVNNLHLLRRLGCHIAAVYFSTEEHEISESDLDQLREVCHELFHGGKRMPQNAQSIASLAWDKTSYFIRGAMGWSGDRYPFSAAYDRIHAAAIILESAKRVHATFIALPLIFMHYASQLRAHGYQVILDASDVLSDLSRLFLKHFAGSAGKLSLLANHLACRTQERLSLAHCSEIWVTSAAEAERFSQIAPGVPTVLVPNCLDESRICPKPNASQPVVGFIGTYSYQPNLQAAEFLVDEVFPQVLREIQTAKLLLAGVGLPPKTKKRFEHVPNVRMLGLVSDSSQFMAACHVLALPVRVRGGVPLKLVEALAHGRAIVAASETVRGVPVVPGRDLLSCDTAQEFASAVVALLRDSSLRERLENAARAVFTKHFSLSRAEQSIRSNSVLMQRAARETRLRHVAGERKSS